MSEIVQIDVREARRLEDRFLTRANAVFYARLTFLLLGLVVLLRPSWRAGLDPLQPYVLPAYLFSVVYTGLAQMLARHPRHGRWVMFVTLNFDLAVLLIVIANTGGLLSPVMAAQVLFTLFFALLFPNPIAIIPPLVMLPAVVRLSQLAEARPAFEFELLFLLWYAALNGIAVYVTVYLTGREEQQNREILELEGELKKLAVVEERNRLARDIHDGLGAALSGLIIQSEYLLTLARGDETMSREVSELKVAAEEAIDEVRRALSMMRDEFELVPQLENACTVFTTRFRIPVDLTIEGEPPFLTDEQQLTIFRIMQECLTNTAKHAAASQVVVRVRFSPAEMSLELRDNGCGFDPEKRPKGHYGLINIKERARKVGGAVEIISSIGKGTLTTLRIPAQSPAMVAAAA